MNEPNTKTQKMDKNKIELLYKMDDDEVWMDKESDFNRTNYKMHFIIK